MKREKLTNEEVDDILYAIGVCEDEAGGNYETIKEKLYFQYPEVKADRDKRQREWDEESKRQDDARRIIADFVYDHLFHKKPILPQLERWISDEDNYSKLRKHYSDDICLAADLWKYHLEGLKKDGLLTELRKILAKESEKPENYWMRNRPKATDDELWHTLARRLEVAQL